MLLVAAAFREARADPVIPCAPVAGGAGTVAKIIGPTQFVLDGGARVALAEVSALPVNKVYPGKDIASAALEREALGKRVSLYFDGAQVDRHGRALAQVFIEGAADPWLQRSLVEQGAAYVDTWPTNRTCARELLASEAEARGAERGLWADQANRILSANEAADGEGRFAIVEGEVLGVTKLSKPARIYVDFGPDWHTDFTIRIEGDAARLFGKANIDPEAWRGNCVRVRGYVGWRFGPEIEVENPEQVEPIAPAECLEAQSDHEQHLGGN
ncbi:MAG TPA: thermonuclease family protein [Alphaproteobacteria bacterium]|nr:thermonuclease family protein [Alphaproteobacteria bacterium]